MPHCLGLLLFRPSLRQWASPPGFEAIRGSYGEGVRWRSPQQECAVSALLPALLTCYFPHLFVRNFERLEIKRFLLVLTLLDSYYSPLSEETLT